MDTTQSPVGSRQKGKRPLETGDLSGGRQRKIGIVAEGGKAAIVHTLLSPFTPTQLPVPSVDEAATNFLKDLVKNRRIGLPVIGAKDLEDLERVFTVEKEGEQVVEPHLYTDFEAVFQLRRLIQEFNKEGSTKESLSALFHHRSFPCLLAQPGDFLVATRGLGMVGGRFVAHGVGLAEHIRIMGYETKRGVIERATISSGFSTNKVISLLGCAVHGYTAQLIATFCEAFLSSRPVHGRHRARQGRVVLLWSGGAFWMMPFLDTIRKRTYQSGTDWHDRVSVREFDANEHEEEHEEDAGAVHTVVPCVLALVEHEEDTREFAAALAQECGYPAQRLLDHAQGTELRKEALDPEYILASLDCGFASGRNQPTPERTKTALEMAERTIRNAKDMEPSIITWETTGSILNQKNDDIRRMLEEILRSPDRSEPLYDYRLFSICPKTHVSGYESRMRAVYIGLCRDRKDFGFGHAHRDDPSSVRNGASAPMWPGDKELKQMLGKTGHAVSMLVERRSPSLPSRQLWPEEPAQARTTVGQARASQTGITLTEALSSMPPYSGSRVAWKDPQDPVNYPGSDTALTTAMPDFEHYQAALPEFICPPGPMARNRVVPARGNETQTYVFEGQTYDEPRAYVFEGRLYRHDPESRPTTGPQPRFTTDITEDTIVHLDVDGHLPSGGDMGKPTKEVTQRYRLQQFQAGFAKRRAPIGHELWRDDVEDDFVLGKPPREAPGDALPPRAARKTRQAP